MSPDSDRRGSRRRHDRLTFVFHYLQNHVRLDTVDLSLDGAMLESPVVFPSGTLIVLEYFSGLPGDEGIRLLTRVTRVTRSFRGHSSCCGLGVDWVRAYTMGPRHYLQDFLVGSLGYPDEIMNGCTVTSTGLSSVTLRTVESAPVPAAQDNRSSVSTEQMTRFNSAQQGRFKLQVPVMYSLENMHYRGTVIALGTSGIGLLSQGSLPFLAAKFSVRFPLGEQQESPKVLLFCQVELLAEPVHLTGTGAFSAKILGIDELDSPGGFRTYLKQMPSKYSVWPLARRLLKAHLCC